MIYCSQLRATPSADCNISHIALGLSNYLIHNIEKNDSHLDQFGAGENTYQAVAFEIKLKSA